MKDDKYTTLVLSQRKDLNKLGFDDESCGIAAYRTLKRG